VIIIQTWAISKFLASHILGPKLKFMFEGSSSVLCSEYKHAVSLVAEDSLKRLSKCTDFCNHEALLGTQENYLV
jgi:MinD superfamily P-loop ATPase